MLCLQGGEFFMRNFRLHAAAIISVGLTSLGINGLAMAAPVGGPAPLIGLGLPLAGGVIAIVLIARALRK
jgi:hypothetical protein